MPETINIKDYSVTGLGNKISTGLGIKSEQANYIKDPNSYVEKFFGIPWSKQREIIESVKINKITVVQSSNDSGKTWMLGGIHWWWMDVYNNG